MKLVEMFENINVGTTKNIGKGAMGLMRDALSFNAEQAEARTEVFALACVTVLRANPDKYPAEIVHSFPEYPDEIRHPETWFMGGLEVWNGVYPRHYDLLMEEEV